MIVKICGVARREDAETALAAGADRFGAICEIARSPRSRTPEEISRISKGLNDRMAVLTADRGADYLIRLAETLQPAILQLHGNETPETIDRLKSVWNGEIWKALHLPPSGAAPGFLSRLQERMAEFVESGVDRFVIDTAIPSSGPPSSGGTGVKGDWNAARRLVEESGRSIVLAGGLTPDNVRSAAASVRPDGVDVSGGVEREKGVKDPNLVRRFVSEARAAGIP